MSGLLMSPGFWVSLSLQSLLQASLSSDFGLTILQLGSYKVALNETPIDFCSLLELSMQIVHLDSAGV